MRNRVFGGPASSGAGPRFFRAIGPALAALLLAAPARALDWIPPRPVTAVLPTATLAPSSAHGMELLVLAAGAAADLNWSATASGNFPLVVSPSSGSLSVPAGGVGAVSFTVTLADTASGLVVLSVNLVHQSGAGRAAKVDAPIYAATLGRPEVKPVPGTWQAAAGTSGSVSFQIHSLIGSSEQVDLTTGRFNPDPNNDGALFAGAAASTPVTLPGGGTITVSAPTTLAANAYAGNLNAVQMSVTSAAGISTAVGHGLVTSPQPASLPTALVPSGLAPLDEPAAGRDGAALLAARGYWLVPAGTSGVRILRTGSTDSIGAVDGNGDGTDDRWVGTIRIPSHAAALGVIPRLVSASNDTLDVGLLAAGRAGLMLLDLRTIEDPPFGTWSDFFDVDGNGVDDRILRTIPLSGFATDVAWFYSPAGRPVALVADADTGSVPVSTSYDRALVVPGTGQGVVAIDVAAALDSIAHPPYASGAIATPGSALDLELRGGVAPDLIVADGDAGVLVYGLTASSGVPAAVAWTPRGTVALSSAWGPPHARDLAWVSNTGDSAYAAAAAGSGGLQLLRVPRAGMGAPSLVLAQQTAAADIGVAGAWTGTLAAALGAGGVALMRAPGAAYLDRIAPGAPAPYVAPVTLARGSPWSATGAALEVASHQTASSGASSVVFEPSETPLPDLFVSDGPRWLLLRPGQAAITAVAMDRVPPPARGVHLTVRPNPVEDHATFEVLFGGALGARSAGSRTQAAGVKGEGVRLEIFDVLGRLVRRLAVEEGLDGSVARVAWDGLDRLGRRVGSGRYWARVTRPGAGASQALPIVILR